MAEKLKNYDGIRKSLRLGGGNEAIDAQHKKGRLTARERLGLLFDPDSFTETNLYVKHNCKELYGKELPADGVITGSGEIGGKPAFAFAQDFTVMGGTVGERNGGKVVELLLNAYKCGMPVIGFNDSGGARIQEGVESLAAYGRIFYHNVLLSGVCPQISIICGPCAGGAVYSPALTDFVIQVDKTSIMFIAGPEVIKAATGEIIDDNALGGAKAHSTISGNVHFVARDEHHAIQLAKDILSFLPRNSSEPPPEKPFSGPVADDGDLDSVIPEDHRVPYDVKNIIYKLVDDGNFLEVSENFAPNIVIGFGRLGGMSVGIVANQPKRLAGVLDINSSDKAARFIRTCNVYNMPIISLVDVPGFMPGVKEEHGGVIRHGAKMLFAYASATVPKLTVVLRKAYGGAYLAMCSKSMGADCVFAWPTAEIAVMGPEGAARVIYRRELAGAKDEKAFLEDHIQDYRELHATPYKAAEALHLDDIIKPSWTRRLLIGRLRLLRNVRHLRPHKKDGNIPL
jgi:acetyl-CoA carboxylase carboxyltransferase component